MLWWARNWRSSAQSRRLLAARILKEEHRIYTEAVRLVLSGKYRVEGRRVLAASGQHEEERLAERAKSR